MIFTRSSLQSSKLSSYLPLLLQTNRIYYLPWRHLCSLNCSRIFRQIRDDTKRKRDDALRVVDLFTHETNLTTSELSHFQLIHHLFRPSSDPLFTATSSSSDNNVFEVENIDAIDLSLALSSCGSARDFRSGVCHHCAAIVRGFIANVYVGTCLVSFYAKCGDLKNAHKVFEEMPVRNVVSWTAIIAGLAQDWRVDTCLDFFNQMRISDSMPNSLTFAALLRACSGTGALAQGKGIHSLTIRTGFCPEILVSNAIVSMYCKSGALGDALRVFRAIDDKDTVSWNSMISGYALHGLASQAIALFEEMNRNNVEPDRVTYLGVLSLCRHAGLVREARLYFDSMAKHGVDPELDHYSIMVDLLGRTGMLEEARRVIEGMPFPPNSVIWSSMLSSSRVHGNVWFGIEAAENRLALEPGCAATYLQLANLYAGSGQWGCAAKVRKLMKDRGLKISTGYSWIEIKNVVHKFRAEDKSSTRVRDIVLVLDVLVDHMTSIGYDVEMHEVQCYV